MTEQKRLQEQMALHDYWSVTEDARPERVSVHNRRNVARRSQRTVRVPDADPSMAWQDFAQRRQRRTHAQARTAQSVQSRQRVLVPRTLAQTGTRASSGRMRAVRRPLPYQTRPVPPRSTRRPSRRGLFWKFLGFSALGVLVLALGTFVLTGNAFRITQVDVRGTQNAGLIRSIQNMGMRGQNIFLVDITALSSRINVLPQVASVDLSKQLPNHLTVHIQERQAVLLWQASSGTFGVDAQGMVIAPAAEISSGERLGTVIDITPSTQLNTGQKNTKTAKVLRPGMYLDRTDVAFARDVMQRFPQMLGISTFKLYYDGTMYRGTIDQGETPGSKGSFVVESPTGWKAYLGGSADTNSLNNRLVELREILTLTQQQQLEVATIDLRYGLRPTFTLRQ